MKVIWSKTDNGWEILQVILECSNMANQWFGDLVAVLTLLSRSTGPKIYSVAMQLYNVQSV